MKILHFQDNKMCVEMFSCLFAFACMYDIIFTFLFLLCLFLDHKVHTMRNVAQHILGINIFYLFSLSLSLSQFPCEGHRWSEFTTEIHHGTSEEFIFPNSTDPTRSFLCYCALCWSCHVLHQGRQYNQRIKISFLKRAWFVTTS